jgi:hypothetical protein
MAHRKLFFNLSARQKRRRLTPRLHLSTVTSFATTQSTLQFRPEVRYNLPSACDSESDNPFDSDQDLLRSPDCTDIDSDVDDSNTFKEHLAQSAVSNHVTQTALSALLSVLKGHKCFSQLPSNSRTLLKTLRKTVTRIVSPGHYVHFGLKSGIHSTLEKLDLELGSVSLQISIDGIPISKSSGGQFRPVLCYLSPHQCPPFEVGIYYGSEKSGVASEFWKILLRNSRTY